MPALSPERIAELVAPYLGKANEQAPPALYTQLSGYLDLLLRWNARTNLTAIRDPEQIVLRHFGESLFVGAHLAPLLPTGASLLDLGSGAGFPGVPIQLLIPGLRVTLAESQNKKAAFLREAVRTLGLQAEVWDRRVELLPAERLFDCVALRAVDNMARAQELACERVAPGGWIAALEAAESVDLDAETQRFLVPGSSRSVLSLVRKLA